MNTATETIDLAIRSHADLRAFKRTFDAITKLDRMVKTSTRDLRNLFAAGSGAPTPRAGGSGTTTGSRGATLSPGMFDARLHGRIPIRLRPSDFIIGLPTSKIPVPSPLAPSAPTITRPGAIPLSPGGTGRGLVSEHRDLLTNIKHVGLWGGSVGALYGGLAVGRDAVTAVIELQYATARLQQVFRGTDADARRLADSVVYLAAVNGRTAKEAMESAIQWSRVFSSRLQIQEAVRVSLVAANVAELTAAQSTEYLSSLVQVYHLRAGELNSVLGMLNQTSNTWNVTNSAMMEGLSRTAAIAKQAGVPLAELIGIIGAGVGATGQTGANLGNAIKTIIGRVQSPEIAKSLRDVFKFEVSVEGGEDIKSFSAILGELFVKYQEMNRAEKQSLLFTMGGKHQASRLAAILDSYVRSQVLAINAQLNLNSAEKENSLITATLRAQLQGLATEWNRFASKQSKAPSFAFGEVAKLMTNALRLMNLPGVSAAVSGLGALMAVMAAKTLLTAVALDKAGAKAGFLVGTLGSVQRALVGMNAAMAAAATNYVKAAGASSMLVLKLHDTAGGAFIAARGVAATSQAMRLGYLAIGAFARSLSVAVVALSEWIIPLAIIGGAIWAANKAASEFGLTSDKTNEAVDQFTRKSEAASNAAMAAAQGIRLYKTAMDALGTAKTPDQRQRLLSEVAEAAVIGGDDSKVKSVRSELLLMEKANDMAGIRAKLEDLIAKAAAFRVTKAQEAFAALRDEDEVLAKRQKELERGKFILGNRKANLDEIKGRRAEIASRRTQLVVEESEGRTADLEKFLAADQKHLTYLERQKEVAQAISDVWAQLPTANRTDQLNIEVAKLAMIEGFHKRNMELLQGQAKAAEAQGDFSSAALTDSAKRKRELADDLLRGAIEREYGFSRAELEGEGAPLVRFLSPFLEAQRNAYKGRGLEHGPLDWPTKFTGLKSPFNDKGELDAARFEDAIARGNVERAQKLAREALAMEERANQPSIVSGANRREGAIKAEREAMEKAQREREAAETARGYREYQTRAAITLRVASAEAESFAVGGNVGQQQAHQRQSLELAIKEREAAAQTAILKGNLADAEIHGQTALQMSVKLEENRLKTAESFFDLQKQIHNEAKAYGKTLAGMGPGELLRGLAMRRMVRGGQMTSGSFWAMDAGSRRDMIAMPEFSDSAMGMRDLVRRNPELFKRDRSGRMVLDTSRLHAEAKEGSQTRNRIAELIPKPQMPALSGINEQAKEAALALGGFTGQVHAARAALSEMSATARAFANEFRTGGKASAFEGPPINAGAPNLRSIPELARAIRGNSL